MLRNRRMIEEAVYRNVMSNLRKMLKEEEEKPDSDYRGGKAEFEKRVAGPYSKELDDKLKEIMPLLSDSNDSDVNSFNITHSQIAYELWPGLDKDAARSKFAQKRSGRKRFTPKEINTIYNLISNVMA